MKIESTKVIVATNQSTVATFLSNAQNLIHLLPQDKISDWKSTVAECSFKVQGGVTISLIHDGNKEAEEIYMKSGQGSPFPFKLTLFMVDKGDQTEGYILFDGEMNMFLKMMVEKPLTALFNLMSENLKKHFDK